MKTFIIVLTFCTIGVFQVGFAQQVSYPLHTGDEWQYAGFVPNAPWRVANDTVLSNGKTYRILISQGYPVDNPTFYWQYHRQEGNKVYSFDKYAQSEFLLFDFDANVGDTISTYPLPVGVGRVFLRAKDTVMLFGAARRHWDFYHDPRSHAVDEEIVYEVTDTIGITRFANVNGPGGFISGARIDGQTYGTITKVEGGPTTPRISFHLARPYPNPFNAETRISLTVQSTEWVSVRVYDVLGRSIEAIWAGDLSPGEHSFRWNADTCPSGLYFVHAAGTSGIQSEAVVLLK